MSNPQFFDEEDESVAAAGKAGSSSSYKVYIRCRKCGTPNCFEEIPPTRVDLALFRGSENPIIKCRCCHADMDTMIAFCGEQVGSEIVHRHDPVS
jgi:hypothetical protein